MYLCISDLVCDRTIYELAPVVHARIVHLRIWKGRASFWFLPSFRFSLVSVFPPFNEFFLSSLSDVSSFFFALLILSHFSPVEFLRFSNFYVFLPFWCFTSSWFFFPSGFFSPFGVSPFLVLPSPSLPLLLVFFPNGCFLLLFFLLRLLLDFPMTHLWDFSSFWFFRPLGDFTFLPFGMLTLFWFFMFLGLSHFPPFGVSWSPCLVFKAKRPKGQQKHKHKSFFVWHNSSQSGGTSMDRSTKAALGTHNT